AVGAAELKAAVGSIGSLARPNGLRRAKETEKGLRQEANTTLPKLIPPATTADEQLKAAMAALQAMGVGKTDPQYGAALEAVRQAATAVSGTDPTTGAAD